MMRKLVAVACCWAGVVTASESQLAFDVYLDDKPVGVHRVILDTSAGEKRVQVEAQFDVKFLAITAYKYRHRADEVWRKAFVVGHDFGYRNSQVTVLAPTGTIGFMMDCDTTGIEPDIALVKYKKLVGGGMIKIVNNTVPVALKRLGYERDEIQAIVEFIQKNLAVWQG